MNEGISKEKIGWFLCIALAIMTVLPLLDIFYVVADNKWAALFARTGNAVGKWAPHYGRNG